MRFTGDEVLLMDQFRLLSRSRQTTEYSCGPAAFQAVLRYWGRDIDEKALMELLQTDPEVGTYPEDIVRGARTLGLDAQLRTDLSLDEVAEFVSNGSPVIALAQVWRSQSDTPAGAEDEWDCGHWVVILAIDKDYVYFQDPYAHMCKVFVPRDVFEEHWHHAMGGDLRNPKLVHLAIFIKGEAAAPERAAEDVDVSALDLERLGSVTLIVTHFRDYVLPYDFLNELREVWASEVVRPDAFIFLRKDEQGRLSGMEGGRLQDDVLEVNALLAAIAAQGLGGPHRVRSKLQDAMTAAAKGDFGLSAGDLHAIGERLGPNHSAMIALFENVWERRLKAVVAKHGGEVIKQRMISPEAIAKVGRTLSEHRV
jgi:predicted double-glycine peptidase